MGGLERIPSWQGQKGRRSLSICSKRVGDGHLLWECTFPPPLQHVRDLPELRFDSSIWGTAEEYGDASLERCRAFMLVPGVMQTVQRAEFRVLFLPCRRICLVI